jgi:hypothetical protein
MASGSFLPQLRDESGQTVGEMADRIGLRFAGDGGEGDGGEGDGAELRLAGDIKVSWKWKSDWRLSNTNSNEDEEYRQVLSQVHYYLNTSGLRYGYILTDREFVAVRRKGIRWGDIEVSPSVLWQGGGCGGMNVALGIWLIHMLSQGSDWEAPTFPRPAPVSHDEVDGYVEDSDDDDSDCSDDDYEP